MRSTSSKWATPTKRVPHDCRQQTQNLGRFNGMKIAPRGNPNAPQAKTWVSLEPGYQVLDNANMTGIAVYYYGKQVH
jgi:hypothetical protein